MSDRDTLTIIAEEIAAAFEPLVEAVSSPESFTTFMLELGWDLREIPQPIKNLAVPLQAIMDMLEAGDVDVSNVAALINGIRSLIDAVEQIKSQPSSLFPATLDVNEFKNTFPVQLIQFLIAEYLLDRHSSWGSLCKALGLIRVEPVEATGTRPAYERKEIAWGDFATILDDPFAILKNAYQWGASDFKAELLVDNVTDLAECWDIDARLGNLDSKLRGFLTNGAIQLDAIHNWAVQVPLIEDTFSEVQTEMGIGLFMLPETTTAKPGFSILPYGKGTVYLEIDLTDELALKIEGGLDLTAGIGILVRPNQDIEVLVDIIPSVDSGVAPPSSGFLAISIQNQASADAKLVLIGSEGGSRFEVGVVSLKGGARIDSAGGKDVYSEFELKDAAIVIKPGAGEADSFLSSLLPKNGFSIDFSLLLGFSASQGFYFGGSGGLEVSLPAHIQVGPIEVLSSTLAIKPSSGLIPIELGATVSGELGPLSAVVENIGLRAEFTFPSDSSGNLGPVDLGLGFKPPKGVGLAIDAGMVKGGGYLYFDFEKEQYAGALELTVAEFLSLKAIGLITTRMPDGSKGFSLLVIITAEFGDTGYQLGYGFTLLGVGGLLGLNRTMRLQPLMEGVRTGAVNRIMFPTNIIANAPRIISDLRTIFPPQEGKFLIGPMAKLGWGTPTLISLSLGIVIEIPGNIAILGVLKVVLPDEKAALLRLQVNFAGAIEFDKKRAYFFAALFESRVLFITIEGEMGVLVAWGADANFLVSVGGFHPQFNPPPLPFPSPKRVALNILNKSNARIQVMGYFGVTSNTVQFGAHADLYFGFSAFNIQGHIGFDALMQFSPFYFVIQVSASVSLKVFGIGLLSIRLRFSLEGPTPWRAKGTGSISLLFFEISADFDITWGETRDTTLPPIEVMPLLKAEFEKLGNWTAQVPSANKLLVSLRPLDGASADLVLHPVGSLRISQRAVPLDLTINKVGNQKVKDANKFVLAVSPGGLDKSRDATEPFAMAQFQEMDNAKKLSLPAYEHEHSGVELSVQGEQLASSKMVKRVVRYELVTIDTNYKRFVQRFFVFWGGLFTHFLKGNAVTKSALSNKQKKQFQPFAEKIQVRPDTYTVAFNTNNQAVHAEATEFASAALAREYMQQQVAADPSLVGQLHVIPQSEVNTSL